MHKELPALLIAVDDDDDDGRSRVSVLVWLPYTDQCLVKYIHKSLTTEWNTNHVISSAATKWMTENNIFSGKWCLAECFKPWFSFNHYKTEKIVANDMTITNGREIKNVHIYHEITMHANQLFDGIQSRKCTGSRQIAQEMKAWLVRHSSSKLCFPCFQDLEQWPPLQKPWTNH